MNFTSFAALAAHVARFQARVTPAIAVGVRAAAHSYHGAIHEKFGEYQEGWPPLAESTIADRIRLGFTPDDPLLRTGELRDSYVEGAEGLLTAGVGSEHKAALTHELGNPAKHIPRRSTVELSGLTGERAAFVACCERMLAVLFVGEVIAREANEIKD